MTTSTDIRPGTVPPWALRYCYDGEEWLVLVDTTTSSASHTCDERFVEPGAYFIFSGQGWERCSRSADCPTLVANGQRRCFAVADTLAEAHAAFDRIEQEWRTRHD